MCVDGHATLVLVGAIQGEAGQSKARHCKCKAQGKSITGIDQDRESYSSTVLLVAGRKKEQCCGSRRARSKILKAMKD